MYSQLLFTLFVSFIKLRFTCSYNSSKSMRKDMNIMLSSRLSSLRKRRNITQAEQAKVLGIARTTYAMYEQGNREPDYDTLKKIADFFDVETDYLLGRTDKPKSQINIAYDGGNGLELEDEDEEAYMKEQLAHYRKMKKRMKEQLGKDRD